MEFTIKGQTLKVVCPDRIVSGTINYLTASFIFSEDWEGLEKWVHFSNGEAVYDILVEDDAITAEQGLDLTDGDWSVYIHGSAADVDENGEITVTQRIVTDKTTVQVWHSGVLEGEPLPPILPSVSEKVAAQSQYAVNKVNELLRRAKDGDFDGVGVKNITFDDEGKMHIELSNDEEFVSQSLIGETGNGIEDAHLNEDYTLTLDFTNGNSYTTPSIRGPEGSRAIHTGLTAFWDSQPSLIGEAGDIYVYIDHDKITGEDGRERFVAGLKMADGLAYLIDQPFITDSVESKLSTHVYDMGIHVTQEEKDFWNNKVRCYDGVNEELIFTTL